MDKAALESSLNTIDIWLIVFGVFVAVGVLGESIAGFLHWRRSGQLQRVQATEILTLQGAIADANARALEAQAALEKYKSPRTLSPEQQAAIAEQMRSYAGTVFTMGVFNDKEPIDLMTQIDKALLDAGWKETEWKSGGALVLSRVDHPNFGYVVIEGVYVQADAGRRDKFGPIVARLAAALDSQGIPAKPEVGNFPAGANKDAVQLLVGKKPQ